MKKQIIIIAIIIVICIAFSLTPRPLVKDINALDIYRVDMNVDGTYVDITDEVDLDALKECLGKQKCSRIPAYGDSYSSDDVMYRIDAIDTSKTKHVSFHLNAGNLNYVYESAPVVYKIKNAESFVNDLSEVLNKTK